MKTCWQAPISQASIQLGEVRRDPRGKCFNRLAQKARKEPMHSRKIRGLIQ